MLKVLACLDFNVIVAFGRSVLSMTTILFIIVKYCYIYIIAVFIGLLLESLVRFLDRTNLLLQTSLKNQSILWMPLSRYVSFYMI